MGADHAGLRLLPLLAPLLLGGCGEPLSCTAPAVTERLTVKLDREMRENPRFLEPHEPDRSSFTVAALRQEGAAVGALDCAATFDASLDASPAYARRHGFRAPTKPSVIKRIVHFTAHRGAWDTYVEVVSLDPPPDRSVTTTTKVLAP